MNARDIVEKANQAGKVMARWAPIERVLTFVCVFSPLVMVWIDPEPLRGSISGLIGTTDRNTWSAG